jgi:hypothetical protein
MKGRIFFRNSAGYSSLLSPLLLPLVILDADIENLIKKFFPLLLFLPDLLVESLALLDLLCLALR